jgi:streptogramin lyase
VVRTLYPAPNANAYAERFVRSIKEECLERILPIGEHHFRRAVREFVEHYYRERNHQGLQNALIAGEVSSRSTGRIRRRRFPGAFFCGHLVRAHVAAKEVVRFGVAYDQPAIRRDLMRLKKHTLAAGIAAVAIVVYASSHSAISAQGGAALTGTVTSQAEGKMEGVVITARRDGSNFDVSVVSDASGRYTFPRTHLVPGTYTLKIRAVGYELPVPATATVEAGKAATADLALLKAADESRQLTTVEWAMNLPGTDAEKDMVLKEAASCIYCHNLERIVRSKYTADQFPAVVTRMAKYYLDGSTYGFEGRGRAVLETLQVQERNEKGPNWPYSFFPPKAKTLYGPYLATINQNGAGKSLPSTFKTLPRPKGVETKVIITQYDMPRKDTVPHDGDLDKDGNFWYSDQSALFIGRLDTHTGTFKEWAVPPTKRKPAGVSDVVIDSEGYVWFPATSDLSKVTFGMIMRFDPKTETFAPVKNMPADASTQFLGLDGKGKLWSGFGPWFKIDRKTNTFEEKIDIRSAPNKPPDATGGGYQVEVDSKGNPVLTDFIGGYIAKMDGATKQITFIRMPIKDGMPRRGRMDKQDRFWFSFYRADSIGMLDMKTDTIKVYPIPLKYFLPYTVSYPDQRGRIFAPSNTSDRLARIDTKTGDTIMYLMPTRDFDTKKIAIDPKDGKTVWFANKRSARVVKVEQLD